VAQHKDYGLVGAGRSLQLGKQGPKLLGNSDTNTFLFTTEDGISLARVQGANAQSSAEFVTKAQLDSVQTAEATFTATMAHNSPSTVLGTIPAGAKTVITTLTVNTVYDGIAQITVGTDSSTSLLMGDGYNELDLAGSYQTITTHNFLSDTELKVYLTANNTTQGNATIVVSYY
jgi:hypothetical protein